MYEKRFAAKKEIIDEFRTKPSCAYPQTTVRLLLLALKRPGLDVWRLPDLGFAIDIGTIDQSWPRLLDHPQLSVPQWSKQIEFHLESAPGQSLSSVV